MTGKRIGYIRVSTLDENTVRQLDGVQVDKVYTDRASGKDRDRPQLEDMIDFVRDGDTVLVHSMDRLARNLEDLRHLVRWITDKQVRVEFVKEQLAFTEEDSAMSTLLLNVMGAFAEFERSLILERQRESIALAKQRKVYRGRAPALDAERAAPLREKAAAGVPKAALAREFGISRETVYAYLRAAEAGVALQERDALIAALPADKRPLPDVAKYDELLPSRRQ
ncbi:recombinase family protein [Plantibacter sp. YIM 135347]|uniref:recombinase family protein n=1 Tax=Plantibacter sp. YIM 135347 TaxID=3423919 RepID=UPI003D33D84C